MMAGIKGKSSTYIARNYLSIVILNDKLIYILQYYSVLVAT